MKIIDAALLALALLVACRSPNAPSKAPDRAHQTIETMAYLVPTRHPTRTGAHPQSLWWDGQTLTNVKGYDSSQVEQWEFDGAMWRHVYDRTDGTGTAYRLLPGDWIPATWRVGETLDMRKSELVRYDMSGRLLKRVAFPYTMHLSASYDVMDVGGIIGEVPIIDVEYQPLQVNGQPHLHPNKEVFRFAKGYGLVGWMAEWDSRGWLWFNESWGPPIPPGFMVSLAGR